MYRDQFRELICSWILRLKGLSPLYRSTDFIKGSSLSSLVNLTILLNPFALDMVATSQEMVWENLSPERKSGSSEILWVYIYSRLSPYGHICKMDTWCWPLHFFSHFTVTKGTSLRQTTDTFETMYRDLGSALCGKNNTSKLKCRCSTWL